MLKFLIRLNQQFTINTMKLQTVLLTTLAMTTIGLTLYFGYTKPQNDFTYLPHYMEFKQNFNKYSSSP